jgi:hypothetical protein
MMSDSQWLPRLQAQQIRKGGRQYFVNEQGNALPSVTTILNATKPQVDKERLWQWKQRVGVTEATRIATTAGRRGTGTHKQIERYLQGKSVACSEAVQPYWDSIAPVLQEIEAVRLVEGTVFHSNWRYAGRVDCVASYRGIPCVCDWKTADVPKGSLERLYDGPLQLAAYAGAVNESYRDRGVCIDHALLVVALPGLPAEVFWLEPATLSDYGCRWRERVEQFWQTV